MVAAKRHRGLNTSEQIRNIIMQIITTKTPVTLTALTNKLFAIPGTKATAASKEAQAALREANPQLGELTKLPAGTLVVVPEMPGLQATALQPESQAGNETVARLQRALADARTILKNSNASQTEDSKTSLELIKDRKLTVLVRETPELRNRLAQITAQSKLQLQQIEVEKTDTLESLTQLEKDLRSLIL